jgi:uncharacterized surface protein with fasciclin (FAS1) repeats
MQHAIVNKSSKQQTTTTIFAALITQNSSEILNGSILTVFASHFFAFLSMLCLRFFILQLHSKLKSLHHPTP